MVRRNTVTGFALFLAVLLIACSGAQPSEFPSGAVQGEATNTAALPVGYEQPTSSATATITPTPMPSATFTSTPSTIGPAFPPNVNPLTGLVVRDPSLLDRRPLAVKVSNYPRSLRPHTGLSFADLVFHFFTEEGMSRFTAIFLGNDSKVGPLRSARMVDIQLTHLYQAILAYAGADQTTTGFLQQQLANRAVTAKPSRCPAVCPGDPNDINGTFADTGALTEYALANGISEGRQPLDGMVFDPVMPSSGVAANSLHVQYAWGNRAEWQWDSMSGRYLRYIEDWKDGIVTMIPLTDRLTGETISSANAVILFTFYMPMSGNEKYNIEFWSSKQGRALFLRDGRLFEGFWLVQDPVAPLIFQDMDGNTFPLKPGNTWFDVVGKGSMVSEPNPGEWKIHFQIP